jgi:uncharacterized protein YkwD
MALAQKAKPNSHHRKRVAQHHKHSKHYLKTYLPYMPMLMTVVIGLAINVLWSSQASQVLGAKSDFSATSLLGGTNTERAKEKEAALSIDSQLTSAAQAKATDMVTRDYWSHDTPDGKAPWTFIAAAGYSYQAAGENLAYGFNNASDTITGWMNSKEHRDNILNIAYSQVGFGVASASNYQGKGPAIVVVAMYGEPTGAAANITFNVPDTSQNVLGQVQNQPSSRLVSRIQLLTGGQAPWSFVAVAMIAGGALMFFILRHGLRLKKLLVEGETFFVHHPVLDTVVVFVITVGFVLTRSSGIIR